MCTVQVFRLIVSDPEVMSRVRIHATNPHHLPVDACPGCHLIVERVTVDVDGPEFEDALSVSFAFIVGPLRVHS